MISEITYRMKEIEKLQQNIENLNKYYLLIAFLQSTLICILIYVGELYIKL